MVLAGGPVQAQHSQKPYATPLDTLMNTHLTTRAPEAKGFVRETSPDKDHLDYTPLTGTDPVRPKPRDAAGIAALQAELEGAAVRNIKRAQVMMPRKSATHKSNPAKAAQTAASASGAR